MKIRILVAAAALVAVAGCDNAAGGSGGTAAGSALPATGSATSVPTGGATGTPPPSAPPTATPTGSAPTGGTTTAAVSRCHTSQLSASFRPADAAAGNRYATLVLTNRSRRTCTIDGFGGLQPLNAAKQELPITLTRNTDRPAPLTLLVPGAGVGRTIHWGVVPSGTQPCPTPVYAAIIPPDETDPLVIGWSLGPVCGGKMDGWPYGVTL